jgi:hypothetical protein
MLTRLALHHEKAVGNASSSLSTANLRVTMLGIKARDCSVSTEREGLWQTAARRKILFSTQTLHNKR